MKTTFDPAVRLDLYFRVKRNGTKLLRFFTNEGLPYDISAHTFEANIKFNEKSQNKIQLVVTKPNTHELLLTITEALSTLQTQTYYWELYLSDIKKTWLTGNAVFHQGKFSGFNDTTTDVTLVDESINIVIIDSNGDGGSTPVASVPPFIFDDFISYVDELNSNIGVGWYRDPITQYNTGVAVGDLYGVININNAADGDGWSPCSISLFAQIDFSKFKEMKFKMKSSKTVGFYCGLASSSGGLYALGFTQAADSEFWLVRTNLNGTELIIPSTKVITEGGNSNWYTFKVTNVAGLVSFYIDEELVHSATLSIPDEAPLITNFGATGGEDETFQSEFSLDYYLLNINDTRNIF